MIIFGSIHPVSYTHLDYYRMKNIQADTSMRENIAKPETTFGNEPLSK